MKKSIIIVAFLLNSVLSFSQKTKNMVTDLKYSLQTGLDKFIGTWTYQLNDEQFTIVLKKKEFRNDGHIISFIEGYHIYKNKGVLVDGSNESQVNTISVGTFNPQNKNEEIIEFRFFETRSRVRGKGTLSFKHGNINQLFFKLYLTEGGGTLRIDGQDKSYKLHVPSNVTLKRVK